MISRTRILVLMLFLCLNFPALSVFPSPGADPFVIFIIDFSDFVCPPCLGSLLSLCESLPKHLPEENIRGIVVISEDRAGIHSENRDRILLKKIRGFQKANQIRFPLILDKDGMFASAAERGSCVFLLDTAAFTLLRFSIPLSRMEFSRLLERISEGWTTGPQRLLSENLR